MKKERLIHNVAYTGEGRHKTRENNKTSIKYKTWHTMIRRCYDKKLQERQPRYIGCTVCEEWLSFQNFGDWYDENFYTIDDFTMSLDKDILVKGNKVYSPETCIFVPKFINNLFTNNKNIERDLPLGVIINKKTGKYKAQCSNGDGVTEYLGYFETQKDAFLAYKTYKENLIRQIAEKHKEEIPRRLYNVMESYEI
ncbi:HNH endonuclease [Bacillus phage vB_BanS_Sophrita]|uniref:AP2 domain n=1 Tax=Bacillus phage vB_BanS_Sophrita TaxID=2894790 RepID=A0AAE8YU59_9CAUD|nr:HNH endonuclease [Bacillus phage vB_BanS_Sophrita]UGO50751.1 AP2 domain [Bacillus phage vB_BanS_Sophrita]